MKKPFSLFLLSVLVLEPAVTGRGSGVDAVALGGRVGGHGPELDAAVRGGRGGAVDSRGSSSSSSTHGDGGILSAEGDVGAGIFGAAALDSPSSGFFCFSSSSYSGGGESGTVEESGILGAGCSCDQARIEDDLSAILS